MVGEGDLSVGGCDGESQGHGSRTRRSTHHTISWLICFIPLLVLVAAGAPCFFWPSFVVMIVRDDVRDAEDELMVILVRVLGCAIFAIAACWGYLWLSSCGKNLKESMERVRVVLASEVLVGLLLVVIGLLESRRGCISDGRSIDDTLPYASYLLVCGGSFVVVPSIGLMVSFWPLKPSSQLANEARGRFYPLAECTWLCGWSWCCCGRQGSTRVQPVSGRSSLPPPSHAFPFGVISTMSAEGSVDTEVTDVANNLTVPLLQDADHNDDGDEEGQTSRDQLRDTQQRQLPATAEQEVEDEEIHSSRIAGTNRLMKLAGPQRFYLYCGCVVLLIRLPFSLSIPHFVSTTIGALSRASYVEARTNVLLLFVLGTIDAALDFWCVFLFGFAKERIVRSVRLDTFAAILRQEVAFFDRRDSGELTSRLNADCGEMAGDLTWFFRFSIEAAVRITGIVAYMFIRSPLLGLCAVSIVPIVGVVNKLYGDWLSRNAKAVQTALASANCVAQEALSCARTVIAFASEDFEHEKYEQRIEEYFHLDVRQLYATGVYYMVISTFLINTCVQASLLLIGASLIEKGKLNAEILLAFMLYQGQLQEYTLNLFQSFTSIIKSSGAGDKVFALLDRKARPPGTGAEVVTNSQTRATEEPGYCRNIELCNVSFSYPTRPQHSVLRQLNLDVSAGSTVALVGPSGCGKSTVVGLLQRFYDPTEGEVKIDGINLRELDLKAHRRRLGIVTQEPVLFSGTIFSNIAYGMDGVTREDIVSAAQLANAHDFIMSFPDQYHTQVGERGVQLSGGQKQRVAIARAIIRKPSILLLDEATSALDSDSEKVVQDALDRLLKARQDMTTVVIAHRLQTVRSADSIAVIEGGRVCERGTHEELMALGGGRYRRMVEGADAHGVLPDM